MISDFEVSIELYWGVLFYSSIWNGVIHFGFLLGTKIIIKPPYPINLGARRKGAESPELLVSYTSHFPIEQCQNPSVFQCAVYQYGNITIQYTSVQSLNIAVSQFHCPMSQYSKVIIQYLSFLCPNIKISQSIIPVSEIPLWQCLNLVLQSLKRQNMAKYSIVVSPSHNMAICQYSNVLIL